MTEAPQDITSLPWRERKRHVRHQPSQTTIRLAGWLTSLGELQLEHWIEHEREGDWVDIYVPKFRVAIEVNGFHHTFRYKRDSARSGRLWRAGVAVIPIQIQEIDKAEKDELARAELVRRINRFCYDAKKLLK